MGKKQITTLDDLMRKFRESWGLGMKAVKAAAETYAMALVKYPLKADDEFRAAFPTIREDTWKVLKDIGNGTFPPECILMHPRTYETLREAKVPADRVKTIVNCKIPVVIPTTGSTVDVPFHRLTPSQAMLAIDPVTHNLRPVEKQLAIVRRSDAESESRRNPGPVSAVKRKMWKVKHGKLLVFARCTIQLDDLREIVKELEDWELDNA